MWTFRTDGAFGTAAASQVIFVWNGNELTDDDEIEALSTYVDWEIGAAIALGVTSHVVGNMKSLKGAVALGAGAIVTGSITAADGAVSFGASAESGDIFADGAVNMGALAKAGNVASNGLVTLGAGAKTGHLTAMTVLGKADAHDASNPLSASLGAGTSAPFQIPTGLNGADFVHGLYTSGTAITNSGTVTIVVPYGYTPPIGYVTELQVEVAPAPVLDNPTWKFKIEAAFTTAAASKLDFKYDDGSALIDSGPEFESLISAVEFDVTDTVTIGAGSKMYANMKSEADITLGAGAETGSLITPKSVTMGAGAKAYGLVEGTITVTKGAGACTNVAVPLDVDGMKLAIEGQCDPHTYAALYTFPGLQDKCDASQAYAPGSPDAICCAIAASIPRWYPAAGASIMTPSCGV